MEKQSLRLQYGFHMRESFGEYSVPDAIRVKPEKKISAVVRIGILSLAVNVVLVTVKLLLAGLTGSLALRADGIHSLVDVFVSLTLVIGLFLSQRKSRNFPYGLYKIENVAAAAIALLLFFAAYEIIRELIQQESVQPYTGVWVLAAVAAVILVPLLFSRFELSMGRKFNSPGLRADGMHFTADVLSSSVVFLSLLGQSLGLPLDRIGAAVIVVFISYSAWGLLAGSMRVLLDASVSPQILDKIKAIISEEPAVDRLNNLTGRNSGRYIFIEADVAVRLKDLAKAHEMSEELEGKIRKAVPNIDRVLIHYEPVVRPAVRYAVPLADSGGRLSEDFGTALYFAILELNRKDRSLVSQQLVANPFSGFGKGRGLKVAAFLSKFKPDAVISREQITDKGPGFALEAAGSSMETTPFLKLDEVLSGLQTEDKIEMKGEGVI